jgi:hypothetical protein
MCILKNECTCQECCYLINQQYTFFIWSPQLSQWLIGTIVVYEIITHSNSFCMRTGILRYINVNMTYRLTWIFWSSNKQRYINPQNRATFPRLYNIVWRFDNKWEWVHIFIFGFSKCKILSFWLSVGIRK